MSDEFKEYEAAAGDGEAADGKKTSPWMWVAIGCGGITVLAVLAVLGMVAFGLFVAKDIVEEMDGEPVRAIAEMAIGQDPNLEIIDSDEGTFTIREKSTGEEITIDFEDIMEGKLSFSTEEGNIRVEALGEEEGGVTLTGPEGDIRIGADASLDDVPGWVPLYPDAEETMGNFHMVSDEGLNGVVSQLTKDDLAKILEWFKKWLEDRGFDSSSQTISTGDEGSFATLTAEMADEGYGLSIVIAEADEGTSVTVTYTEGV